MILALNVPTQPNGGAAYQNFMLGGIGRDLLRFVEYDRQEDN